MPARLLKEAADQLAPILTTVFRASYIQSTTPVESANVVPVFKKGDHASAANYRLASLTSICCKVMEHIISSQVMRHLDKNDILTDAQHGFRKRRSWETQLLLSSNDFMKSLDSNTQTDVAKAFDEVAHQRLLLKLQSIGMDGFTLRWIRSFLSQRDQTVILE